MTELRVSSPEVANRQMMISPWLLALRPKTITAAIVPVLVATALVKFENHPLQWWITICALLSAVFIQIATNLLNDAIDFVKGADTEKRVGPIRVTQSGLLSSKQVMWGGYFCLMVAAAFGVPLVVQGGWPIVVIGLVSLLLAYAYTGGPFPLAYRGLGDVFVVVFFGLVAVGGTYYLHTGGLGLAAVVAGLQVGSLATVLIAVNNLRDAPLDREAGKRTLAVRLGERFAKFEIATLAIAPFLLGIYWKNIGAFSAVVLPCAAIPLARRLIAGILKTPPGPEYNRFLALAAALHLAFGLLLSIGLWVN